MSKKKEMLDAIHRELKAFQKKAEEKSLTFEEAIKGETFTHPKTKNEVQFYSLPADAQKLEREKFKKMMEKKKEEGGKGEKGSTKDKAFREKVREKALTDLKGFSDTLSKLGDEDEITEAVTKKFREVLETYGVRKADISNLTGEELEDLRDTLVGMDKQLTREYNDKQRELQKEYDKKMEKVHAMREKADQFEEKKLNPVYNQIHRLSPPREGQIINDVELIGAALEDAVKKYEEKAGKLFAKVESLEKIHEEMMEEADELDDSIRNRSRRTTRSMMDSYSWDGTDESDAPYILLESIEKSLGGYRRTKALEKEKKEEEEKKKQTIKDYKKKISDLAGKVKGIDESKGFTEALSELNLMKGQLSNSEALSELEADFNRLEKEIKDTQEKVKKEKQEKIKKELEEKSWKGKLKKFFGLGKKASEEELVRRAHKILLKEIEDFKRDYPDYKD